MLQYLRKVRLSAKGNGGTILINHDGTDGHDLKIGFSITKGISSTANGASIRIWNLSKSSRNALGKELDEVILEAGYMPPQSDENNVGVIFKGQIRDIEHRREGADIITTLACGEGDKAFKNATISKTYPSGTKVETVLDDIYGEFKKEGVSKGEWKLPDKQPTFKRPYSVCGTCKSETDQLSRSHDFYWSIQNGTMEVIPGSGYVGQVILISPESGLIDSPTITDNGIDFKCLLNPAIRPNRRVAVRSQTLDMNDKQGEYRVSECTYSGDNREGDFTVQVKAESINNKKVDEGKRVESQNKKEDKK